MECLEDDSKTREEVLAELRNLRTRLQQVEKARRVIRKEKNNQAHRHAEEEIRWTKEREKDRASSGEILHFEKMEHRHSEEELGKTRSNFGMFPLNFSRPKKQKGNESLRKSMMALGNTG